MDFGGTAQEGREELVLRKRDDERGESHREFSPSGILGDSRKCPYGFWGARRGRSLIHHQKTTRRRGGKKGSPGTGPGDWPLPTKSVHTKLPDSHPFPRKDGVSGNVATDSILAWERQRKRVRPKKMKKPKEKSERIRIRPDAIVVEQKTENAIDAETSELMEAKVDGASAANKFKKVRRTKSDQWLIELQRRVQVAEVRNIDLVTTKAGISRAI
ncbi:hypothetical protein QAD02_020901 [Eretmocerus hayati]|uniref:Uncharacterized protein n=1 Tax=Eretmocerus hayati TaxID=131215 RepID=A0ACC2PQ19_9HYME|nr:hypothetical protein QAD02_020901 [Eretmocerus hayati]